MLTLELSGESEDIPPESLITAEGIIEAINFENPDLVSGLNSTHWLMEADTRDKLVSVLSTYPPPRYCFS